MKKNLYKFCQQQHKLHVYSYVLYVVFIIFRIIYYLILYKKIAKYMDANSSI